MLIIKHFRSLYEQGKTKVRGLLRQALHHHINEFLNRASHELRTPLTAIKGNIQVAQRRLATLKRQIPEQPEQVSEKIERVQRPLEAAVENVRLEEQIIQNLIDDARIQTNTLELLMKSCNLIVLLREAVARKQESVPDHPIVLEIIPPENVVPIIADGDRITRVINIYLENALSFSPTDRPVTVQLVVDDAIARVSGHDAGPTIPFEEQERLWERYHFAKRIAGEHEPDQGFGLDFYLCRVFIERHDGTVGVQSDPDHGTTFWFTLPIETTLKESVEQVSV